MQFLNIQSWLYLVWLTSIEVKYLIYFQRHSYHFSWFLTVFVCLFPPMNIFISFFLLHLFSFIFFFSFPSLFSPNVRSPCSEISRGGNYVYFTRHSVPSYFSFSPADFHIFLFPILSTADFFVSRCPQTNMSSEVFSILTFCFRLGRQSVSVRLENV